MDERDHELLDKQLRHLQPRNDGETILLLLGMFLAGVMLGSTWFGHQNPPKNPPTRIASNDVVASTMLGNETSLPQQ